MRNRILLAVSLALSLTAAAFAYQETRLHQQWEYHIFYTSVDTIRDEKNLNDLGKDGWELVQQQKDYFILKRQK